jgi:hypothetical protein
MSKFQVNEALLFNGREVVVLKVDHTGKFGQAYTVKDGDITRFFVSEFDLTKKESQ